MSLLGKEGIDIRDTRDSRREASHERAEWQPRTLPELGSAPMRKAETRGMEGVLVQDHSVHPLSGSWKDMDAIEIIREAAGRVRSGARPRPISALSYGNLADALDEGLRQVGYPYPLKVLVPDTLPEERLAHLAARCEVTEEDLRQGYKASEDILKSTGNRRGWEAGSFTFFPTSPSYVRSCDETLATAAAEGEGRDVIIYEPFGTGNKVSALIRRVNRWHNEKKAAWKSISVVGATPEDLDSAADMLPMTVQPPAWAEMKFLMDQLKQRGILGPLTGVHKVKEPFFAPAVEAMEANGFATTPSGAAGEAARRQLHRFFPHTRDAVSIVVNSGTGIDRFKRAA